MMTAATLAPVCAFNGDLLGATLEKRHFAFSLVAGRRTKDCLAPFLHLLEGAWRVLLVQGPTCQMSKKE